MQEKRVVAYDSRQLKTHERLTMRVGMSGYLTHDLKLAMMDFSLKT